jgi:hypothetical protein
MARFLVNVQLEVLVMEEETPPGFVDQKVVEILLGNQVGIIPMTQWSFDLNDLSRNLFYNIITLKNYFSQ